MELNRALALRASNATSVVDDRMTAAAALAALTEPERRAVLLSAHGLTDREVADRLAVTHQRARTLLMDARALLRSLADHSGKLQVAGDEARSLPPAGPTKRERRLIRRHLEHCAACHAA